MWGKTDGLGQGGMMRRKQKRSWMAWSLAVSPCGLLKCYSRCRPVPPCPQLWIDWMDMQHTSTEAHTNSGVFSTSKLSILTYIFSTSFRYAILCIATAFFFKKFPHFYEEQFARLGSAASSIRHWHDLSLVHPSPCHITPSQNSYSSLNEQSPTVFHLFPLSFLPFCTCRTSTPCISNAVLSTGSHFFLFYPI